MWLTLTQGDGQKIAINFTNVKLLLPTSEGTEVTFNDGGTTYVKENLEMVTKRLDNLRDYMRGN